MKLNELLERDGFTSVNERTNISIDNLIKLVDNNFEALSRVKALGFLSILSREYEMIELDDLNSAIRKYFEENSNNEDNEITESVLVKADRNENDKSYFKWIIIAALLTGLWYLYSNSKLGGNLTNVNSKKSGLKDREVLQNDDVEDNVIIKNDNNKTTVEIQTAKPTPIREENSSQKDKLNSSEKVESNKTEQITKSETKKDSEKLEKIEKKDKKENQQEKSEEIDNVDNVLDETTEDITQIDDNSIETSQNTSANEEEKAEIIYNVTVNPRVNLWFGFINLDTKARKEFITTESTPIDVGEQRWVLITGHGRLSVASELSTLKINDSAKHYFYIDSSEIREINRAEFKALNDGRGW